jgi:hypothetical protein
MYDAGVPPPPENVTVGVEEYPLPPSMISV